MKLRNRILSILLVACMLVTLLPVSAGAIGTDRASVVEQTRQTEEVPAAVDAAEPQETEEDTEQTPEEYRAGLAEALEANQPEEAQSVTVTAEEVENPGVDLKQNLSETAKQDVETAPYEEDETVRVIVVLEDKGLLEQGFSTAEIAASGAKVERQVETLAQRQENVLQSINRVVDGTVEAKYRYNVALNGLAVEIPYGDLEEIRALPGVKTAFVAPQYSLPEDATGDTTANPYTFSSKEMIGSAKTWETLGYTGQGMRIAIIDTGLDLDHPSFTAAPELTEDSLTVEEVASVLPSLNAYRQYKNQTLVAPTAQELYRSEKVPFGFNYVDTSLDITHDNDTQGYHGTHVAGIAAANKTEGTTVVGVAPDAQLIILKVFGQNGGAYFDDIMAALEDAIRLNADAVNMSLGSPAGFTSEYDYIDEVFERIDQSDMIAAIAAGNSFSAALGNGYGTDRNLTEDPDNSLVSSPGTYAGGTIVASVENEQYMINYLTVGEEKIPFNDVGAYTMTHLAEQELTYVMVPGYGTADDFTKVNVEGKVAVVSRGSSDPDVPVTFVEKQENAFNAGAIAIIVYDNVEGELANMMDAKLIPNVFVSKASGAILSEKATDGEGTLVVQPYDDLIPIENPVALQMSDFSSWGTNPDLELSPDITAPGGNIYSTIDGGLYGTMSGTSMASPHVAGMSALVLEYLRDKYSFTNTKIHTVAEALLMSTSEPLTEPSGVLYSPRKQGAGSANSTIFAMKAVDWTRTPIGELKLDGETYLALDMAFDYTTNTLFVLTDELTLGAGGHLVKLNYHTGEVTDLGVVTGIDSESKQGVTLACDNEGVLYTVDYSTGDLYTINKKTLKASFVGKTGYNPSYVQSMTVDHETDKLYWAAYAGYSYRAVFYEVNKTTGELTTIDNTMYNGEITGLFKPYRGETDLHPENAKLESIVMSKDALMMCAGNVESLQCRPLPFYAELGEITWTSSDKKVATVVNGTVTAVGEGEAVITAKANGVSATCRVTVGKFSADLRLYDASYKRSWMSLDAAAPQEAKLVSSSIEPTVGFMSGAYADGYVYAADYGGRFYRLNPMTMEGDLLGYNRGTLYAMAFNYNDAYMYALQQIGRYFYLSRVNTSNGDTEVVQYLDEETFGIPGGGLAIDYEGNFYTIVTDITTGETILLKFHLENDKIAGLERASLAQYTIGLNWCSMVYSGENEGIFWADGAGQLLWIDASDMEDVKSVVLGSLPGIGTLAWDVAMFEIP